MLLSGNTNYFTIFSLLLKRLYSIRQNFKLNISFINLLCKSIIINLLSKSSTNNSKYENF